MGGSASRELEAAQSQVRRLTVQLQQAQVAVKSSTNGLQAAASATQSELKQQLSATKAELISTVQLLERERSELPKFKRAAAVANEKVLAAQKSELEKGSQMSELQAALRTSKEELEQLFGRLKFAETESAALRKLRARAEMTDDKKELAEQQKAAADESVRLVTEASAALVEAEARPGVHPVFGQLLHDFGDKRIYLGSPTTLWAGTLLWERQRAFRQERATLIAAAKAKSVERGWPGSISIVETGGEIVTGDGNSAEAGGSPTSIGMLIDGQHRLGAAHLLAKKNRLNGALAQILVEVYTPREESAIKELFTEINRAEPVLLVDLPGESGGASSGDNAVLTAAAETLRERYPHMFKPSHACRSPHLNVDMLRAEMHSADVLTRQGITSSEALVDWIEAQNEELASRPDDAWGSGSDRAKKATLEKALGKAREQKMYLGLSWEWLHRA